MLTMLQSSYLPCPCRLQGTKLVALGFKKHQANFSLPDRAADGRTNTESDRERERVRGASERSTPVGSKARCKAKPFLLL